MTQDNQTLILLKTADSNWDLYYEPGTKEVHAIATPKATREGCHDSYFGSIPYYLYWVKQRIKTNPVSIKLLTPTGRAIWQIGSRGNVPAGLEQQKTFWHVLIMKGAWK